MQNESNSKCCSFVLVAFIHGFNIVVEFKVQNEKWKINLRANPKLKLRTWIKRKTWSPFISGFSLYDLLLVIYFELPLSSDHYQQFWVECSLLHLHNANQVYCSISQSDGEKGLLNILQASPGSAQDIPFRHAALKIQTLRSLHDGAIMRGNKFLFVVKIASDGNASRGRVVNAFRHHYRLKRMTIKSNRIYWGMNKVKIIKHLLFKKNWTLRWAIPF